MMENKEKNFISAVLYIHNDGDRLEAFLHMIINALEGHFEHSEIICVNDCSADGSADIVRKMGKETESATVTLLNLSYFHGLELAMDAGIDLAIGDFILEFDSATLDFGVQEILGVYQKALEGNDIVSASPASAYRMLSRLFYWCFDHFSEQPYGMKTERFRMISRRAVNRIEEMNSVIPYRKAVYANCGLRAENIAYSPSGNMEPGSEGRSKAEDRRYRVKLATEALLLFTNFAYRFSMAMTLFMMAVTAFAAVYAVVIYTTSRPVAGWTTTILFLSAAFFGMFGIMTIIIKYLQILVELVFRKKRYSYESIEKMSKC